MLPEIRIRDRFIESAARTYLRQRSIAPRAFRRYVCRISNDIDGVLESGYVEQLCEDAPWSPFATIANSEKPDKVCAKLLEGRVAVMVDGTPFVLTMPMLFTENFQLPVSSRTNQ